MKEIINFSTKFESLETINPLITKYRINICVPDKPANKYVFSKEVIEGMSNTIRGAGVYAYYFENENQLGGHEDDIVRVGNNFKRTGIPVAYGFSDPYQEPYWMEKDGEQWYTTNVYIWTGRNPEVAEILEKFTVNHSMEVAVDDVLDLNGNKRVKEALFLGFCLLQGIDPAFSGSKIEKFSLPIDDVEKMKQEYESFAHRYESLDFKIPQAVKKAAQEGLDLRKEYGRGGTSVGLATARYLIKNEVASPEKVRHIAKYFPRHSGDNLDDKTSNGWIAWCLWGSYAGRKWSTNLVEKMNALDERNLSFMSDTNFSEKEDDKVNVNQNFSLNSSQILEVLNSAFSEFKYGEQWRKYWANAFDDQYVYVYDSEDSKMFRFTYSVEDNKAVVNFESKEEVIQGSYIPVGKTSNTFADKMKEFCDGQTYSKDEQEVCKYSFVIHDDKHMFALDHETCKMVAMPFSVDEEGNVSIDSEKAKMAKMSIFASDEEDEDEVYMAISKMFSANQNVDAAAMQKMNEDAAAENKRLAEENNDISQKFSTLETEHNALKEETEKLRKFKSDIEDQNKKFTVESTLKDVADVLPEEAMKECRDSAEKFSLDDIDIWKNEVKAKAFNFSKQIPEKRDYLWMALPNAGQLKKGNGLWD